MSKLHKFGFEPIDECGRGRVTIDDKPIKCRGFELKHYVDEVPSVNIEVVCVSQIEETASISVSNKEEIAALMDKDEFEEFCKVWDRIHNSENGHNSNIKFDICDTNPNCENDPANCGFAVEYSTFEDVIKGIHRYMCGLDKCKYQK